MKKNMVENTQKWRDRDITISLVSDPEGDIIVHNEYISGTFRFERDKRQYRHTNPSRYARHRKKGGRR